MNDVVTTGIFIVVACERITEYILVILFAAAADLEQAWAERLGSGVKALITALFNVGLYWLLFRFDFVTPVLAQLGISIAPWQGLVFCSILVGGGSNLVHEFFSFFKNGGK